METKNVMTVTKWMELKALADAVLEKFEVVIPTPSSTSDAEAAIGLAALLSDLIRDAADKAIS